MNKAPGIFEDSHHPFQKIFLVTAPGISPWGTFFPAKIF